ncbi:CHASE2 domain-containing protein [Reichenbachiella ulvae]|uniref:CHASE2 domain-containing protein n=1 Tax=Reichenbachiella ulvae TaxID=2980104 RepID=A0ABT3CQ34_9BACT|nr:CHASE2 domain-containing protein [Reichenbachiella ulvae]MCV9385754.1 CHASE2 domain-containing protein [Reichenbachiella ulvae]
MFKKFWLDTIFGLLFILAIGGIVSQVFAFKVFDVFDPIGDAFADMESTDIVFSQLREDPVAEEDIIMVNVGTLNRQGIADLINIINAAEPRVIGVDLFFYNQKKDTLGDLALQYAFSQVENLVLVSKLLEPNEENSFDSLATSHPMFNQYAETAFANFITGAADQEDIKVCRTFAPKEMVNGEIEYSLAVKLVQYMDSVKAQKFLDRNKDVEVINYRGNIFDYGATEAPITYFALDWYQIFDGQFAPELIKDKCVLFCFMGAELGDRIALEDKYFTPLNAKYAGKAHADMFGGVVHANAMSMILAEDYINEMDDYLEYLLAIVILYLNIIVFVFIYKVMPKWYDGLTKLIQLIEAFALFTLGLVVFNVYNYQIDNTWMILGVLIAGDALEVYFGVFKNLFTKEGRKELTQINKL